MILHLFVLPQTSTHKRTNKKAATTQNVFRKFRAKFPANQQPKI
jgi:hypothetical protein